VLPEFDLIVSTTAPASAVTAGADTTFNDIQLVIAPMQTGVVISRLTVVVKDGLGLTKPGVPGAGRPAGSPIEDYVTALEPTVERGQFPKGVWGIVQQAVPKSETVDAVNRVTLSAVANISVGTVPIDSRQVEVGPRHPLPFLLERAARPDYEEAANSAQEEVADASSDGEVVMDEAQRRKENTKGKPPSQMELATYRRALSAPPQLVPLTFRMLQKNAAVVPASQRPKAPAKPAVVTRAQPPRLHTLLTPPKRARDVARVRTTVGATGAALARITPKRLAELLASLDPLVPAKLVMSSPAAVVQSGTVVPSKEIPSTGRAGSGATTRRQAGVLPWQKTRLDTFSSDFTRIGADLLSGEVAVLSADRSQFDIDRSRPVLDMRGDVFVRLVALDGSGNVILDQAAKSAAVQLPLRTATIALIAGASAATYRGAGWHSGTQLAQVGPRTFLGPACSIVTGTARSDGSGALGTRLALAAGVVDGYSTSTTRFASGFTCVAVIVEGGTFTHGDEDVLELGLSGADRAVDANRAELPPAILRAGNRVIHVFDILPGRNPFEVTVASGGRFTLAGVVAGHTNSSTFIESLSRRDLDGLVGSLTDSSPGKTRVRWTARATVQPPGQPLVPA
jgi:hypothetical protein